MPNKTVDYEEAVLQLETIAQKMEAGEFSVDELVEQLKKAQRLIKLCNDKLQKTDDEIRKILEQGN